MMLKKRSAGTSKMKYRWIEQIDKFHEGLNSKNTSGASKNKLNLSTKDLYS